MLFRKVYGKPKSVPATSMVTTAIYFTCKFIMLLPVYGVVGLSYQQSNNQLLWLELGAVPMSLALVMWANKYTSRPGAR